MIALRVTACAALCLIGGQSLAELARPEDSCTDLSKEFSSVRFEATQQTTARNYAEAVKTLKYAFSLCPDNYDNARDLALAEIAAGDRDPAKLLLRQLILKQDRPEYHVLLGRLATDGKDYKEAAAEYQIAARAEPTESNIFDFGTALIKIDFSAATDVLEYGLRAYPSSVRMHVALALALYAQDRIEEGARLLCQASELNPLDAHPMEVLADTERVPPSVEPEAVKHLERLQNKYPTDGLILFDLAMIESGRWSGEDSATSPELIPLLKSALGLNPQLAKAYYQLALIYDEQARYADEIDALRRAIAIEPKSARYHYRVAFAYRASGDEASFHSELAMYAAVHGEAPH